MDKDNAILAKAKLLARAAKTWADLSNALFDPLDGEVARYFPGPAERARFRKTEAYDRLHAMVEEKMRATGLIPGATPRKSGRFVVRLPRSLHAALEREAAAEGTSLNQLVVAKVAARLESVSGRLASLIQAFGEVRDGFSVDRVVADPQMNRSFLRRCRELGLAGTDFDLNWGLLEARKNGQLSGFPKTKKHTVSQTDEFEYASELAVRHLQLRGGVSLDRIICDPPLAEEFDRYAERLAPGYSPLQYRWVALGLRKAGRLGPKGKFVQAIPEFEALGPVSSVRLDRVPQSSGLYLFSSGSENVFLGQTENLHHRLEKHFNVSEYLGLPNWLWNVEEKPLDLALVATPEDPRSVRQKMEIVLVKKLQPRLNYQRRVA